MKRSIDDVSNTVVHSNKKPRSNLTPREQRHDRRDRIREEENKVMEPTPREQRHIRRDRVREEENRVGEKDRRIDQKQAKKRERQEEVESVKIPRPMRSRVESKLSNELLKATHSTIQMAAIPLVLQHRDVINVVETCSGKAAAFISRKPKIRRFALKGRLPFGPDASLVNFFPDKTGHLLLAFPAFFTFYIVFLIFLVAASDPGIIPRTQPSSDVDDDWDTTYENFRYRYERRKNPFNHGCVHNFKEVLFSKTPRSQNDFRAFVKPEIYSQYDSSKYFGYAFSLNFSKKSYETESSVEGSDRYLERCETNPADHSSKWAAAPVLHRLASKFVTENVSRDKEKTNRV
ncbi:probable protein S-acyltransferase 7 [Tanacetum coccineum]|uniref:Probable protein S-acyltransferase 7 n=1 Tax=Tanacetum coccineum TaxID=301880 RepID=A0ABQ5FKM8_9ASTR